MTEIALKQSSEGTRAGRVLLGAALVVGSLVLVVFAGYGVLNLDSWTRLPAIGFAIVAFLIGIQGARTNCGWNAAIRLAGQPGQATATITVHSVGVLAGAATTALILTGLGQIIQIPLWVVAALLLVAAPFRILRPTLVAPGGWKVRREWERWGTVRYMGVFGYFLGLGFVTTMASPLFVVCVLWATSQGDTTLALFTLLAFGTGRIVTTVATSFDDSFACSTSAADKVIEGIRPFGRVEGLAGVATGVLLLIHII